MRFPFAPLLISFDLWLKNRKIAIFLMCFMKYLVQQIVMERSY